MPLQNESNQFVLYYDSDKCTGCTLCMVACSYKHYGIIDYERSFIQIVEDPDRPFHFIGIHCSSCEDPLCMAACPVQAITKDEKTGWVLIQPLKCIGCKACIIMCPISIPKFDERQQIAVKCDYCQGDPYCVKYCTTGAITFIPRIKAKSLLEAKK